MAFNPNVVLVAPGDLITAQHLNNVRANLDRLDTTKALTSDVVLKAGSTMTGALIVVSDGSTNTGIYLAVNGLYRSYVTTPVTVSTPSQILIRAGTAGAANGSFTLYQRAASDTGAGVTIGSVAVNSGLSGVVYNTTSDGRLKDDLGPVADPLDVIGRLRVRHLRWKDTGYEFDGFIAQDVADVVPDAVSGDPDGDPATDPMQLDVSRLVPYLVGAVQELTARVAELTARVDELEAAAA